MDEISIEGQFCRIGDPVRHPGYGLGIILGILPGPDAGSVVLSIQFETAGKKLVEGSSCSLPQKD